MVDYNNIMYELFNSDKWSNFYHIIDSNIKTNNLFNVCLKQLDDELYEVIREYNLSYYGINLVVKQIKKEYLMKQKNQINNNVNIPLSIDFDG
jgi:arginase family enzyme